MILRIIWTLEGTKSRGRWEWRELGWCGEKLQRSINLGEGKERLAPSLQHDGLDTLCIDVFSPAWTLLL